MNIIPGEVVLFSVFLSVESSVFLDNINVQFIVNMCGGIVHMHNN